MLAVHRRYQEYNVQLVQSHEHFTAVTCATYQSTNSERFSPEFACFILAINLWAWYWTAPLSWWTGLSWCLLDLCRPDSTSVWYDCNGIKLTQVLKTRFCNDCGTIVDIPAELSVGP